MTLLAELTAALGPGAVLTGDDLPVRSMSDASETGRHKPLAVLRPTTTAEISAAVAICAHHQQTLVPQGGMTGLSGGANPAPGDVALSLERFAGIEDIDAEAASITLRAGTVLQVAQDAAAAAGFLLPIDLGSRGSCQIGGILANNAGGLRVIRHGMARDNLLGLEVVLADGSVISDLGKLVKNNTGYNLPQLFTGSEGTLGIITRAVLRLRPLPTGRCTALCALSDFDAVPSLLKLARTQLPGLSALEVMWQDYFALMQQAEGVQLFSPVPPLSVIIETESTNGSDQTADFEAFLAGALEAGILTDALIAQSTKEANAFWAVREGHRLEQIMPHLINLDISLDIGRMGACVDACRNALHQRFPDIRVLFFGHAGDGNLHIAADQPKPGQDDPTDEVYRIVYDLVRDAGGSISAEHGIGTLKRDYLSYSRTPEEITLMRLIKLALDPDGILNPGKLL
ncbi:FAD-binding oxidoreductase [Hoeflea sp. YIM 152468]|uniref:FAD-binding oxidoreductase n=1 Tax=Hoeflea sp. YIM 152468 TaxID=3031759 RepID=UPI0023DA024D|nr:FAD-binding oxidoreductase [Hoeflea sp. YIM 152468]MDF1608950.1 FAD-binding oxidoreductase [Hoeflea sp. YIM 152468]